LETLDFDQVTVGVNSATKASELGTLLSEDGFPAVAVHADMPRAAVAAHQQRFKDLEKRVLVSTDLTDGCTDAPHCDLVINFDAAEDKYGYCFRLPQTRHFQTSGRVVTFVTVDRDDEMLTSIQEELGVKVNALSVGELKP
jgi:superfamily II DNA/RNA helicase